MCSRIDMQTHDGRLGFTLGSAHAEVLSWTICLPTLMLIAQAFFLFRERTDRQTNTQTHKQADATERPTPRRRLAWVISHVATCVHKIVISQPASIAEKGNFSL